MPSEREKAVPTIQVENDRIIVAEWSFSPGAETTWHTHEYDYVAVPQTTEKLLIESETADKISELTVGQSYSRQKGIKHNVVNTNGYQFTFIKIELK